MTHVKRWLKRVLSAAGYEIRALRYVPRQLRSAATLRVLEFDDVVCRRMVEAGSPLTFIQIGCFDGITGDPLHKYIERFGWYGVLVEPQARGVLALRELYRGNTKITVVQAAVDAEPRPRTLFTVEASDSPTWVGGLASFDRETILKHASLVSNLSGLIREERVDCITFDEVLRHLPHEGLDLLQVDVEGGDAEILSLFPFDRLQPAIVHWEVKHLSLAQRERCLDRLAAFGYRFAPSGSEDMVAVRF